MAKKPRDKSDSPFETGMLAFARSLQITEGLFYGHRAAREGPQKNDRDENGAVQKEPIRVLEKGVRGQTANDFKNDQAYEKDQKDTQAGNSNIQTVHSAVVPQGCEKVELSFSLRVLPMSREPHATDVREVGEAYRALTSLYAAKGGYDYLAVLFFWNIANGRFAWRNRFMTDAAEVRISSHLGKMIFDPSVFDLDQIADRDELAAGMTSGACDTLDRTIDAMGGALAKTAEPFVIEVSWIAEMTPGQEVFPSQEYLREARQEKGLSRVYASLPTFYGGERIDQASMHSQKIGAAIRHIDAWHNDDDHGPIAVNPYGGVQESGHVLRNRGSKRSLYEIRRRDDLMSTLDAAENAADIPGDIHFLVANLVRGGVFGRAKES